MRLDEPSAVLAITSSVVETHVLMVSTRCREHTECFGVDDVVVGRRRIEATLECIADTRRRSRWGRSCSIFIRARSDVSSMPPMAASAA